MDGIHSISWPSRLDDVQARGVGGRPNMVHWRRDRTSGDGWSWRRGHTRPVRLGQGSLVADDTRFDDRHAWLLLAEIGVGNDERSVIGNGRTRRRPIMIVASVVEQRAA